jgi:hypothetical protein
VCVLCVFHSSGCAFPSGATPHAFPGTIEYRCSNKIGNRARPGLPEHPIHDLRVIEKYDISGSACGTMGAAFARSRTLSNCRTPSLRRARDSARTHISGK